MPADALDKFTVYNDSFGIWRPMFHNGILGAYMSNILCQIFNYQVSNKQDIMAT